MFSYCIWYISSNFFFPNLYWVYLLFCVYGIVGSGGILKYETETETETEWKSTERVKKIAKMRTQQKSELLLKVFQEMNFLNQDNRYLLD